VDWITRHWRILAVFVFVTSLSSQMPARLISHVLPENVTLTGVSGTIWSGRAARAWVEIDQQPLMLGQVQWRLQPWRILWGAPLSLSSVWGQQALRVHLAYRLGGSIILQDAAFTVNTQLFKAFFPLYLGGALSGEFAQIAIDEGHIVGAEGVVRLLRGVWTARSGDLLLGDYQIDFSSADTGGSGTVGVLKTIAGSLLLSGDLSATVTGYQIAVEASGPVARDDAFRQAMSIIAIPNQDGFSVSLTGQY
jgi:hypothetical protein